MASADGWVPVPHSDSVSMASLNDVTVSGETAAGDSGSDSGSGSESHTGASRCATASYESSQVGPGPGLRAAWWAAAGIIVHPHRRTAAVPHTRTFRQHAPMTADCRTPLLSGAGAGAGAGVGTGAGELTGASKDAGSGGRAVRYPGGVLRRPAVPVGWTAGGGRPLTARAILDVASFLSPAEAMRFGVCSRRHFRVVGQSMALWRLMLTHDRPARVSAEEAAQCTSSESAITYFRLQFEAEQRAKQLAQLYREEQAARRKREAKLKARQARSSAVLRLVLSLLPVLLLGLGVVVSLCMASAALEGSASWDAWTVALPTFCGGGYVLVSLAVAWSARRCRPRNSSSCCYGVWDSHQSCIKGMLENETEDSHCLPVHSCGYVLLLLAQLACVCGKLAGTLPTDVTWPVVFIPTFACVVWVWCPLVTALCTHGNVAVVYESTLDDTDLEYNPGLAFCIGFCVLTTALVSAFVLPLSFMIGAHPERIPYVFIPLYVLEAPVFLVGLGFLCSGDRHSRAAGAAALVLSGLLIAAEVLLSVRLLSDGGDGVSWTGVLLPLVLLALGTCCVSSAAAAHQ